MTDIHEEVDGIAEDTDDAVEARKPGLPSTLGDIQRKSMRTYTLNDEVDRVLSILMVEDEEFRSLLEATDNNGSVEGTTRDDDVLAAALLRDKARQRSDLPLIKDANTKELRHSIGVCLRRLRSEEFPDGLGRLQRKRQLDALES